jgi:kynurenine formamidase
MVFQSIEKILEQAPSNWGKWDEKDELGAVNYLGPEQILEAVETISKGKTFTLGLEIAGPTKIPTWPTRSQSHHYMTLDKGHMESGKVNRDSTGGWEASDDVVHLFNHGTTHVDALGHVWYDDKLYNGYDANSTKGGLDHGGVENLGESGIVGKGALLDIARHRGVDYLEAGERVELEELEACAREQGINVKEADVLLLRLGAIELYYESGKGAYYDEYKNTFDGSVVLDEPGPTYTDELAEWFAENEIALYGTDSISGEQTISDETGTRGSLHPALIRDQGVVISELNWLRELAADCADDGKYVFCYMSSPLKISGGTGSPVNPIALK